MTAMGAPAVAAGYNFAYLDEQTKRMIRRALLKAVAIPGYQVPFGSREMPLPYGWGTGGIQVTAIVRQQADGSVRLQFDTSGQTAADPTLIDRITRSYNANMGR